MGQSYKQYLPEGVAKWYRWKEEAKHWRSDHIGMAVVFWIVLSLSVGVYTQIDEIALWGMVSAIATIILVVIWLYHCEASCKEAVAWMDYQTERYNLRLAAFDLTTCHHVLACIAWTLHYCKPGDSRAMEMAKRDLRNARGVMELLYGDEARSAGLTEITVRDLHKRFPLGVVLQEKLAGQELLDLARVRAKEVGVTIAA